ncbi:alpha/beta hydrolase family protein [Saccharicrinis sp. FJH62]|uniref:alpha/beta hydrolase family protein n=1 Tax=Saccharicrinis sp. FJH62 TaxID=3344657 RepID=UPI0035D48013
MKKHVFLTCILFLTVSAFSQDISGTWNGLLKVQGMQLRLVFHISKTDQGLDAKMDSPDQSAFGIPVSKIEYDEPELTIEVSNIALKYTGTYMTDSIVGTFTQMGQSIPLVLRHEEVKKEMVKRPQDPVPPYPYKEKEVTFENKKDNITLAGTLTLPSAEGKYPAVILITGSGPQDRNEEIFGHKPFLIIADYLTRHGIAVLRYDDRGVGKSTGDFQAATSNDFVKDVESALDFLKTQTNIDSKKIGLVGHSEGGLIAPIVAVHRPDVDFIVLLAGPGLRGDKILLEQQKLIGKVSGMSDNDIAAQQSNNKKIFDLILNARDTTGLKNQIRAIISDAVNKNADMTVPPGMDKANFIKMQTDAITTPWMLNFIKYNPAPTLEKVKCPVLALNGENDLQVPPKDNLSAIESALKKVGNKNVTVKELPGLNHLFQHSETGNPTDYGKIEETFSPAALEIMTNWIKEQTN